MNKWMLMAALAATVVLSGCGRTASRSGVRATSYGSVVPSGTKPAMAVDACCRSLATGQISLAQCFENPACKAKGNTCCMNAVKDMAPARL